MSNATIRDLSEPEKVTLETLIDQCGLAAVLGTMSEIAGDKAAHIAASYETDAGDHRLSGAWSSLSMHIADIAEEVELYI